MNLFFLRKFPWIKQHDAMQCGAACLTMICHHYGKKYSLEYITTYCHPGIDGISILGITNGAKSIGMETLTIPVCTEELYQITLPCILHWNQNHFVVLYEISKNGQKYKIADPGKGLIVYDKKEFESHWINNKFNDYPSGIVVQIIPLDTFFNQDYKKSSNNSSLHIVYTYLQQYHKYFIHIAAAILLTCILQLILPFLTQAIVDIGIPYKDINLIWLILLGELMIIAGRTSTDFIRRWLLLHIAMRINLSLIGNFFIKLLRLPMSFFDTKLTGDLLQRLSDHNRIQKFLTEQALNIIFTCLSFLILGIVLFIYNADICFVFLIGSMCYGFWIKIFLKRRKLLDYELFEQQANNQNKTYQFLTSIQEIKLQNCEQRRCWEWEDIQVELFNIQMKSLKLQQSQEAGAVFIKEAMNVTITVLSASSVIAGQMTLGAMLAIQSIIGQLSSPIDQFMAFIYALQDIKISLERINEIHEKNDEETQDCITSYGGSDKSITLNNINFKYDSNTLNNILNNVSFNIAEGHITAIVGASGSGKTTLIKLLLGYYPITSGEILIAGRNINDYNLKWWRKHCGVVMQDGQIFSESIARNIAIDDGDINPKRLEEAAKIANIHNYIMTLPLKYNTIIGREGIALSQGQKQRILIARAVYKQPDFIFLDEATNSLDAKNEKIIVENLSKFFKNRTVIIVAHRLSTVKNADQIIVMDQGNIREIGNHLSLIKKKGIYFHLIKNQLELGE